MAMAVTAQAGKCAPSLTFNTAIATRVDWAMGVRMAAFIAVCVCGGVNLDSASKRWPVGHISLLCVVLRSLLWNIVPDQPRSAT